MSIVGSAYVVVRAISPSLKKDIQRSITKAAEAATPSVKKAGERIGRDMGDSVTKATARAGEAARPAADHAGDLIGKAFADAIPDGIGKRIKKPIQGVMRRLVKAAGPNEHGHNMGRRLTAGLLGAIQKFRIPPAVWLAFMAIPAIGGALKIIGAYVAGAISLIGAMAPAFAAAGAAGAAGLLTLGGAVAAVMLAFKTESKVLERFQKNSEAVGKKFQTIGLSIQRVLLPQITIAQRELTKMIPVLKSGLTGIGQVVGAAAIGISKTLTSPGSVRDMGTIFAAARPQVANLGSALSSIIRIFQMIAAAGAPLMTQFTGWIATWLDGKEAALGAGQAAGTLAAFMERAGRVAAQLGGIAGAVGRGLMGMFSAATPAGETLLANIQKMADRFDTWANSIGGQSSLKAFFDNALPIIREVNLLIGDILKAIVAPMASGNTGGVVAFVSSLRTDMLPALQEIAGAASTLGPSLTTLMTSISGLVKALADSGALGTFVATLNTMITALTYVLSLPIVGPVAAMALSFLGFAKAIGFVLAPLGGLRILAGPISFVLNLLGKGIAALATRIIPLLIGGLRLLGIAFMANPIGFVIGLIALLVTGLIIAYNKSETFRNIVNSLGEAIVNGLGVALTWLQGVWDTVWKALVSGWDWIQTAFQTGVDFVSSMLDRFAGFFDLITQPFQGIAQYFTGLWQVVSGIFTGNIESIKTGIANMIGGIVRFFLGMPARVLAAIISFIPTMVAWADSFGTAVNARISAFVTAAVAWFIALPGRIYAAVASLVGILVAWATNFGAAVNARISAGLTAAVAFFVALPGRVIAAVSSLASRIATTATTWMNNIRNAVANGVPAIITWFQGLPGRIISALGSLGNLLYTSGRNVVEGLGRGIRDMLSNLLGQVRDLGGQILGAIQGALGIASPSKEMAKIGVFAAQGLVVGMGKMEGAVAKAAAGLSDKMAIDPRMNDVTGSLRRGSLDVNVADAATSAAAAPSAVYNTYHVTLDASTLESINNLDDLFNTARRKARQRAGTAGQPVFAQ